jgi:hypothetical protein
MSNRPTSNDWKIDAKTNFRVKKNPDYNKPTEEHLKEQEIKQKFYSDIKANKKVYIDPTVNLRA